MLVTMGEGLGTPTEQYTRRARIAQSSALPTATDEPASPLRDDSQGEAFPTVSGLEAEQDRETIIKTSSFPHDSTPRQQIEMVTKIAAQDLEISQLKARIKLLKDKDRRGAAPSGDDAIIKGRSLASGKEAGERRSEDKEELVNVLTSLDATTILTSGGVQVVSVPPVVEVSFVVTPYTIRKGKEKMVETDMPKKKKLQEQIDIQLAREIEEQMAREDQRISKQITRDAEIARIYAEEELQMLIDGLDKKNEVIARHVHDYEQASADLSIGEKIELINELVKYQDHHSKILKYQAQQSKPLYKKQQKEFYISVLKSHAGWKTKHFKGMTLEEIKEKFIPVWKQIQDFVPIGSKKEGERVKRKGLRLEQESTKKVKTSYKVSEEDLEEMMHPSGRSICGSSTIKETLSIRQATRDKEKELWVELKRLFEPDVEDQLWTQTQALMHDLVEWRLYDSYGVHHVLSRDQEIFMLMERDYLLRNGLAIVMIRNKL
nr:hypothetical protein [Tanacetum cinerariifolium]